MELVKILVGESQEGQTSAAKFYLGSRLSMINGNARRSVIVERCKESLTTISSGGYLAVLIDLESLSRLRRLAKLLTLRFRLLQVEHALAYCGTARIGIYGIIPDLRSPTIIYSLADATARYAQTNLLPASSSPFAILRKILAWWAGCDISLGAVLVIGRKP